MELKFPRSGTSPTVQFPVLPGTLSQYPSLFRQDSFVYFDLQVKLVDNSAAHHPSTRRRHNHNHNHNPHPHPHPHFTSASSSPITISPLRHHQKLLYDFATYLVHYLHGSCGDEVTLKSSSAILVCELDQFRAAGTLILLPATGSEVAVLHCPGPDNLEVITVSRVS